MPTYSLSDVQAAIAGPGGAFSIGADAGVADEAISYEMTEDKNTMTIGGGGDGMHSLHAGKSGHITIRLLKTSPTNARLSTMYGFQTTSAQFHGQNLITIANPVTGDLVTGRESAFKKQPGNAYAKDGNIIEWAFDVIKLDVVLGTGNPVAS